MSKELIDLLKSYIPSGDGHNSQYANDLADAVAILESKAAPVAYITGQFAGRCVIEAINRAAVLPTGMALYTAPQPPKLSDERILHHLDAILKASGSGMKNYSMHKTIEDMKQAVRAIEREILGE
jgi:hypothetical protein